MQLQTCHPERSEGPLLPRLLSIPSGRSHSKLERPLWRGRPRPRSRCEYAIPMALSADPVIPSRGELDQAEVSKDRQLLAYLGTDISVERMGNL